MKYKFYYNWHLNPFANKLHISTATLATVTATVLVVTLVFNTFVPNLKAQNYNKTWTTTSDFNSGTNSNIDTSNNQAQLASTNTNFSEGFTGTTYDDTGNTNATWDTTNHKLNLPGDPSSGVATDLQAKWKAAVGVSEKIQTSIYDSSNHYIYLGGDLGAFAAYNVSNGVLVPLTSKISWGAGYFINALTFDSTNGIVYLGGYAGKFGSFVGGATPANGTWVDLTSKISADWSTYSIYALAFDTTNRVVYLGGQQGKFGSFAGGATPANGTWTYLNAKISADWPSNSILSIVFDSTNTVVYIAGVGGQFGSFAGGATPANGTWTYLNAKISSEWSTVAINVLAFDSINGNIYLGGDSGKFGSFAGGATPANGTWTYLNAKISANWAFYSIYALSFDSTNGTVFLGGDNGNLGSFAGGATPANGTWTYLVSKISSTWSTSIIRSLAFDSSNSVIYIAGDVGKFGSFAGGATPANGTWAYLASNVSGGFSGYDITASAYDSTYGFLYIGGPNGRFMSYKLSDGTAINLTSKISANFTPLNFYTMAFDSTNGLIYLGGGYTYSFGAFNGGNDPANGTWTNLYSKLSSSDWDYLSELWTFSVDPVNHVMFIGGRSNSYGFRFGMYSLNANPANGTWTNLATKISGWNITRPVISIARDSNTGIIYLGGGLTGNDWGPQFGAYIPGNDPVNGSWVNLISKTGTDLQYMAVNSVVFDSANNKIYLGTSSGKFGVFTPASGGSDPANGTWTNLTSKISTDWSTNTINSFAFIGGKIFLGGGGGKFGVVTTLANPANDVWTNLSSNLSSSNGTSRINNLTYVSTAATVFVGSVAGKFTSFLIGYASNKNGVSLKLNSTNQPILTGTLTATDSKPTNTAITYYLSNNGGLH
jgi:hypothetical protein